METINWVFTFIFSILAASLGIEAPQDLRLVTASPTPTVSTAPSGEPFSVTLTGDVMLGRYVETLIDRQTWNDFIPKETLKTLSSSNLVYINLEGPVTDRRTCNVNMCFSFREDIVNQLHDFGNVVAGIANNHILDQGREGYEDTKSSLKKLNIPFAGQVRETSHIYRTEINGQRISFMGFADFELGSFSSFVEEVKKEKPNADILIVSLHAGPEYLLAPTAGQREFAYSLADAGADVVAGHHPHVVQPFEIYKGKIIFYSLGNFIFDQFWSQETMRGLVAELEFNEAEVCVTPMLVQMNNQGLTGLNKDLGVVKQRLFSMAQNTYKEYQEKGEFCIKK